MGRGVTVPTMLCFVLVPMLALVVTAKPPPKDDTNPASVSLETPSISIGSAESPSPLLSALLDEAITDNGSHEVLIRKRRRMMGGGGGRCRGGGRYDLRHGCRRRNPYLPTYLVSRQDMNDPGMYGYRTRNRNNQGYAYVPKRDEASDLVNVRPTFRPIMHIENPKPISHPKKFKGAIRKTVTT